METLGNIKIPKNHGHRFVCEHCDYVTSHLGDSNKHLSTDKHKMLVNASKISIKCEWGRSYKHIESLYRHKKTCMHLEITIQKIKNPKIVSKCFQM